MQIFQAALRKNYLNALKIQVNNTFEVFFTAKNSHNIPFMKQREQFHDQKPPVLKP